MCFALEEKILMELEKYEMSLKAVQPVKNLDFILFHFYAPFSELWKDGIICKMHNCWSVKIREMNGFIKK